VNWSNACAVVIPCFNEATTIASLVASAQRHLPAVVVVDDGSTDGTAPRAAEAGARVLRHAVRRGKGAALQTGWQAARAAGFTWTLSLDGDGQHAPDDIPLFFECAERTGAAMVVGNRLVEPDAMPWLHRRVNQWMSRRLSHLTGRDLPDSQCGYRLLDLRVLAGARLRTTHFEVESETLVHFLVAGVEVQFVPIRVVYRGPQSKIRPLPDTWRWLGWWLRARKQTPKPSPVPASFGGQPGGLKLAKPNGGR
jgi:glycosyltransferase involved in cell wall biosynthesis